MLNVMKNSLVNCLMCAWRKKGCCGLGSLKLTLFIRLLSDNAQLHSAKLMRNWKLNATRKTIESSQFFTPFQRLNFKPTKKGRRKELIGIPFIFYLSTGKKYQFQYSQTFKLSNFVLSCSLTPSNMMKLLLLTAKFFHGIVFTFETTSVKFVMQCIEK
jgi:hypothetical protein